MKTNEKLLKEAHAACTKHRDVLNNSDGCGCFCCLEVYPPTEIREWTDAGKTAVCPRCGIDSVLGSASGYPVEGEFMKDMFQYWFE